MPTDSETAFNQMLDEEVSADEIAAFQHEHGLDMPAESPRNSEYVTRAMPAAPANVIPFPQRDVAEMDRYIEENGLAKDLAGFAKEIRAHALRGINEVRVQGSQYVMAKEALKGFFMTWCQQQRDRYVKSGGHEGFWHSDSTILNYCHVYEAAAQLPNEYEYFRVQNWPLEIVYRICAKLTNGETVESIDSWLDVKYRTKMIANGKSAAVLEESTGNGCPVPEEYIALIEMCESGEISATTAGKIVDECERGFLSEVVVNTVKFYGVMNMKALNKLREVEDSILNAQRNNEPYNNLFVEAVATSGYVTDEDGDQIRLREMTSREIWKSHIRGRYEGTDGGSDDPAEPTAVNLLKGTIDRAEALLIARGLNDTALVEVLDEDPVNQQYKIKLDKPL